MAATKERVRLGCGAGRRTAFLLPCLALAASLIASDPARAQPLVAFDLGTAVAEQVVLSSDEVLGVGVYSGDGGVDLRLQQLAFRERLGDRPSKPFVGVFLGRSVREQVFPGLASTAGEGAEIGAEIEAEIEKWTLGVEAGARFERADGWFVAPRAALAFSRGELEIETGGDDDVTLADGEAESVTAYVSLAAGRRWQRGESTWELGVEIAGLHTDSTSADDGFLDDDLTTDYERVWIRWRHATGAAVWGKSLDIETKLQHTALHDALSSRLGDGFTELKLALLARVGSERVPVDSAGLSFRYADGDGFDGWTVGLVVSD